MRSAILDSAMRPVVIVLLDPTSNADTCFLQAAILRRPDFLFLQAAMESLDVAVAFRVMISRAAVRDTEPPERFQEPRRSELRAIVGGQRYVRLAAALGQPCQDGLLYRSQRIFGSTTMRKIPSHDLPRAAVDYAHQVRPAHCWPRPDLRHVRLPDLIGTLASTRPHSFRRRARRRRERTSNPRSRITRSTRFRFTGSPFFRCNHQATRR